MTDRRAGEACLFELYVDGVSIPSVVLDAEGRVAHLNAAARRLLELSERDVGRPFRDLEVSYRPVDLRSSVEVVLEEQRAVVHRDVEGTLVPKGTGISDIEVAPLVEPGGRPMGVRITFEDVSHHRKLREELADSTRQLEAAYDELRSTIEELETTNGELQSTIEELEAMNDELRSTDEELHRANEALCSRGEELAQADGLLESILRGLRRAVVVVDTDFTIQAWNGWVEEMWGLGRDEVVGRNLLGLGIGLPVDELAAAARVAFEGVEATEELEVDAHNGRGELITCATLVSPHRDGTGSVAGALLLMREAPGR